MQASIRWLAPAVALLFAAVAGLHAFAPRLHPDTARPRVDWAGTLAALSDAGLDRPTGAWQLQLPSDHGAHAGTRSETWTVSAHLRDERGADVGIQLALLRVRVAAPDATPRASPWEPREIYRGHVTLVAAAQRTAPGEERLHRDVPGVAGHDPAERQLWLDDWSLRYGEGERGDRLRLDATVDGMAVELSLTPAKAALTLNPDGNSAPFRGYSITRMAAEGFIGSGVDRRPVSGLAWLDHLWGDVPLPVGLIALDRLLLQLDDGTDLAVTRTRRRDGGGTPTLTGLMVDPQGGVEQIPGGLLAMESTRTWQRDSGAAPYPLDWRLAAGGLELTVVPMIDDQLQDFIPPLWSGLVTAEGSLNGRRVSGRGSLLLTGYEPQ